MELFDFLDLLFFVAIGAVCFIVACHVLKAIFVLVFVPLSIAYAVFRGLFEWISRKVAMFKNGEPPSSQPDEDSQLSALVFIIACCGLVYFLIYFFW